jgi:hypothetical protein
MSRDQQSRFPTRIPYVLIDDQTKIEWINLSGDDGHLHGEGSTSSGLSLKLSLNTIGTQYGSNPYQSVVETMEKYEMRNDTAQTRPWLIEHSASSSGPNWKNSMQKEGKSCKSTKIFFHIRPRTLTHFPERAIT